MSDALSGLNIKLLCLLGLSQETAEIVMAEIDSLRQQVAIGVAQNRALTSELQSAREVLFRNTWQRR